MKALKIFINIFMVYLICVCIYRIVGEIIEINTMHDIYINRYQEEYKTEIFKYCVLPLFHHFLSLFAYIVVIFFINKNQILEKMDNIRKKKESIRKEKALQKKQEQLQALQDEIKQMKNGE